MTGVYLTMSMAETSMSVMLTILVLRLHHAGPDQAAMWPMVPTRPPCRRRSRSGRGVTGGHDQAAVTPVVPARPRCRLWSAVSSCAGWRVLSAASTGHTDHDELT